MSWRAPGGLTLTTWWLVAQLCAASACVQSTQVLNRAAGEDDAGGGDASAATLTGPPFGTPRFLFEAVDVTLTDDELELFCVVNDDLVVSRRVLDTDPWPPLAPAAELNSPEIETDPTISGDGRTMFFTSYREGGDGDLFLSTRADPLAAWSPPQRVAELSSPLGDCCAVVGPDQNSVLFASFRTGDADIYAADRPDSESPWSAPRPVSELNVPNSDDLPAQWRAGLLVMDSTRAAGGRDVYFVNYESGEATGIPEPLSSINGPANDRDAWLSVDGRRIYFQSDREGVDRIYVAER